MGPRGVGSLGFKVNLVFALHGFERYLHAITCSPELPNISETLGFETGDEV